MSENCKNCNYQLNGAVFCPQCGAKAETEQTVPVQEVATAVEETVATETVVQQDVPQQLVAETVTEQPLQQPMSEQPMQAYQIPPQPVMSQQPQPMYAQPVQAKPSAFAETLKQAINVIINFFSKNVVDAISAQSGEKLNIWIVLFAIPALLSAISGCIHYASPATDLLSFAGMPYAPGIGRFAHFASSLFYTLAFQFAFVIVLYLYSKLIKKKPLSFIGCANLVSSAYLPVSVVTAGYVIVGSKLGVANIIALFMFVALLQKGLQKAYNEETVFFWSFYLVVAVAIVAFMLASIVVSLPTWIISAISSYSVYNSFFNPYLW